MDVYEAIRKRFSVRSYEDRPVEAQTLQRILDAGRLAPSGRNSQPWKFVVVQEAQRRQALAEACDQPFVAAAPVVIAVVGLSPDAVMHCGIPGDPVNCAIAIDHMTLAATAEGLGTCWIGHFDQDACRKLLNVPDSAKIVEMLLLGHPAASPPAKKRKEPDEVICYETFS